MKLRHQHPFLAPHLEDGFIPFAHRGGSKEFPENSLAAFKAADSLGFRYLETDVHVTKDGHLVAFHDSNLSRACGVEREISTMTRKEISQVRISGSEPIPFLEDLLEELPDSMFNIDAKSDETVLPLIQFLRASSALDRICVGSFSHSRLAIIRKSFGERVCTSASPREVVSWMLGRLSIGPSCVQIPLKQSFISVATPRRIGRSHGHGIPVHIWTVDEPTMMQDLIDMGVHGIMTDEGHILKEVALRNAVWI